MDGACEYDAIIVSRPIHETEASRPVNVFDDWLQGQDLRNLRPADLSNAQLAYLTCSSRWGSTVG
jgi:hypothetical protein